MWKRILVLVLFLFGVFWWLSNRDNVVDPNVTDTDSDIEISVDEDGDNDGDDTDSDDEGSEDDEDEATVSTSSVTPTPAVVAVPKVVNVNTNPVVNYQPKVTTPVVVSKPDPVPGVQSSAKVYLYEWGLDMSDKVFPAGTVNFTVQNDGRFTHEFAVRGVGVLGKVTPSMTQTFSAQLRPGTYEVYSDRREDYARGMVDTIVVE